MCMTLEEQLVNKLAEKAGISLVRNPVPAV